MKTIAILSQKGGAGKTTLAINLAVAVALNKKQSVIIDIDPQASASSWHDTREAEMPIVISAQPNRLNQVLEVAKKGGADFVFIDTAPHSESASLASARVSDFAIIPCRPAILDIRAISNTIDLIQLAKIKSSVVLNSIPSRGTLPDEAEEAITSYNIEIAPIRIGQRTSFVHSLTAGQGVLEYEPSGKASQEIKALYKWLLKQV